MKLIILVLVVCFSLSAFSKEFHDVKMDDTEKVNGQTLQIKGMGLREIEFLGIIIRVYVGGLYVADNKMDCEALLKSNTLKTVHMHFLRHVSPRDLNDSLEKGISFNCEDKCKENVPRAKELKTLVPSVHSDDDLKIVFDTKGTEFQLNNKSLGRVEGVDFSRNLLAAFIGKKPPTQEFKDGMCGVTNKK